MTDEKGVDPRSLRSITLIEQRMVDDFRFLGARLLENGDLVVEGQDIGSAVEQFWGEREYEYQLTVAAQYVPALLLCLLQLHFPGNHNATAEFATGFATVSDFRAWLDAYGIPSDFISY